MDYFLICLVAFLGSGLTLFSGFGLGTLLVPVFGFFFPIEMAILLTAIVHFLNNIFKLFLLGQKANKQALLAFGIPAILFAFVGTYFGKELVKKTTLKGIQKVVGVLLFLLGTLFILGIL